MACGRRMLSPATVRCARAEAKGAVGGCQHSKVLAGASALAGNKTGLLILGSLRADGSRGEDHVVQLHLYIYMSKVRRYLTTDRVTCLEFASTPTRDLSRTPSEAQGGYESEAGRLEFEVFAVSTSNKVRPTLCATITGWRTKVSSLRGRHKRKCSSDLRGKRWLFYKAR